jgi:cysteine sulfinate desulfinase/cysteine desulfurase-like protein
VLRSLGINKKEARGSIRISLSGKEKKGDIERVVREIKSALKILVA